MGIGISVFLLSLFAVLDISKTLWSVVPFVTFIQYPWRLLTFTALAMGMCGGFLLTNLHKPVMKIGASIIIIGVCLYMNAKLFRPQFLYTRDSAAFETPQDLRYRVSKVSDEYLPPDIPKPQNQNDFIRTPIDSSATLAVTFARQTDTEFVANLDSKVSQTVTIRQAYFPGWVFSINGNIVKPAIARGLPSVLVLEGKSTLVARFTNTPIRLLGNILSLISVAVLGGLLFYGKKTVA